MFFLKRHTSLSYGCFNHWIVYLFKNSIYFKCIKKYQKPLRKNDVMFILWRCFFISLSDYSWKRQVHFLFLCFLPYFNVNYYYENKNNFKFVHVISVKGSVVTEIMYGVLRWHAPFTDVIIKFQQYYLAPDFIIIFLWHTIFICDTSYHFLPPLPPHSSSHGFTRQW